MPTFDTPEPIAARVDIGAGSVRVSASPRTDTVVEVRPSDETNQTDVHAATQTRIEYAGGRLLVKGPMNRKRSWFSLSSGPSLDVSIELPEGSELDASSWADLDCEGRLGDVRINNAVGDLRIEQTAGLRAKTASGDIIVNRVEGHADLNSSSGDIRIGRVDGNAVLKTASGDLAVGDVTGELRLNTASGDIDVDRALASVTAKTASGHVRVGEVVSGSVALHTGDGEVEVGIRKGTAVWLDVRSTSGTVRSSLEAADGPGEAEQTVEIRARTLSGDIVVRRA
jgi:DUF4097 and DUF4098 domain-containing protein YvlB